MTNQKHDAEQWTGEFDSAREPVASAPSTPQESKAVVFCPKCGFYSETSQCNYCGPSVAPAPSTPKIKMTCPHDEQQCDYPNCLVAGPYFDSRCVTLNPATTSVPVLINIHDLLVDVAQLLDGWHADGTAWTEWDESIRQRVSQALSAEKECYGRPVGDQRQKLREQLAALAHEQWSDWLKYIFARTRSVGAGVSVLTVIPPEWAERWRREMWTPYGKLSKADKDTRRADADHVIAVLDSAEKDENNG